MNDALHAPRFAAGIEEIACAADVDGFVSAQTQSLGADERGTMKDQLRPLDGRHPTLRAQDVALHNRHSIKIPDAVPVPHQGPNRAPFRQEPFRELVSDETAGSADKDGTFSHSVLSQAQRCPDNSDLSGRTR